MDNDFSAKFHSLTGNSPLSWQARLYVDHFLKGDLPTVIGIPTGLGKTMVMAVWLIARANKLDVPTRLIYVVDRRTVIDQATDLAEKLLKNWKKEQFTCEPPAISTLRGQLADTANGPATLPSLPSSSEPSISSARHCSSPATGPATNAARSKPDCSDTPVILPGYDDHKPEKTIKLIQRALAQSRIEQPCEFEWSAPPNFKNCLTAHKYDRDKRRTGYFRPDHLKGYTAVHLRLKFDHPYSGPLTLGAGRHCGLGLFAAIPES